RFSITPILPSSLTSKNLELISANVVHIENKKLITKIFSLLPKLEKKFQHLKRVYNNKILISIGNNDEEEENILSTIKELVVEQEDIKIFQQFVPKYPPLTQSQCELAKKYWPISFHKNILLESKLNKEYFSLKEIEIYSNLFIKVELIKGVLFYDPQKNKIICTSTIDLKHPLKHKVIECIDNLAKINEKEKNNLEEDGQYLGTGFDAILFKEPCTMCAMALTHCRIKRIFFNLKNERNGALISKWRIQELNSLNHNFEVFQINEIF
ncbi:CMP/dCMP-type deaminase domain-containing protein, partial [Meloidogyne graminicola]